MEPIPDPIPVSEPYFDLGPCHFPITTTSSSAQQWFDRGLALCYSFNHEEAVRCFYQCLAHDLECPMAYWGIAYSLGANYNKTWEIFEPGEVECVLPKIKAALDRVSELEVKGDKLETALIGSLRARMPDDLKRRDYEHWNRAYIAAMREVYETFPDNLDVTALYAEAMMVLTPWKLWDVHTGLPAPGSLAVEIETVLESAMKRFPSQADQHPGILHFYIHLTEMSSSPEKALPAANALQDLLPDAGHIQHMPSTSISSPVTINEPSVPTSSQCRPTRNTSTSEAQGGFTWSTVCIVWNSSSTAPCSRGNIKSPCGTRR
jgi:hypothetical protein